MVQGADNILEVPFLDVEVNRSAFNAPVAQEDFDILQIYSAFQHVGGKTMSQSMKRSFFLNTGFF